MRFVEEAEGRIESDRQDGPHDRGVEEPIAVAQQGVEAVERGTAAAGIRSEGISQVREQQMAQSGEIVSGGGPLETTQSVRTGSL
jgi:hypothetical protein